MSSEWLTFPFDVLESEILVALVIFLVVFDFC